MSVTFQVRRDTSSRWASINPVLALGEPGLETDTRRVKYGDGSTPWNNLLYQVANADRFDIISAPAAVQISGHVAVIIGNDGKAYPANNDSTAWMTAGVTTGNVAQGSNASIQINNVLVEPGWSWSGTSPVWLGPNGTLTQTLPTTGALVQIGIPTGSTSMKIEVEFYALLS